MASEFLLAGVGRPGVWVKLHNNNTGTDYFSTAQTDSHGLYVHNAVGGRYTVYTSSNTNLPPTGDASWTATGATDFLVPYVAGDDIVGRSFTATSSPYAPNAPTGGQATGGSVFIGGPNPWIDVKAPSVTIGVTTYTLGAKGDGVTDDTTPLNNAETAAAVNGATISYPSGTYIISNQIVINGANITHRGASRFAAVIKRANTINQHMVHCTSAANAEFMDIGFDENGANNITIPHAIWMGTNSSGVVIERCRFFNCDGFAVFTQETPGNFVDNLRVIDCDFVQNTTGHWDLFAIATTGGIVQGNRFTVGGVNSGLSIYEANDTPVVANVIYGQGTGAKIVTIASVLGCAFTGNTIIATANDIAIWLICEQDNANNRNCVDTVISGNTLRGVGTAYGVFINGGAHANLSVLNTVIGNNIFDGFGIGIYVFLGTVTGLNINHNFFTAGVGIQYAGGTISRVRVDNNDFTGTATVVTRNVVPTNEFWNANIPINSTTATTNVNPANPAGTTSGAGVMMGCAGSITPVGSGKVRFMITGDALNNTATDGGFMNGRYGTGTAPVNAAAVSGTVFGGNTPAFTSATASAKSGFVLQGIASGLVLGTAYWIDISLGIVGGGTASVENICLTAEEIL